MIKHISRAVIAAVISLFAMPASAQVRVVTTTTDLGYFARTIGARHVHVDTICQGAQDPHFVQARPSYMVTLSRAQLLIAVGLELEVGWLPSLVAGARNPQINPGHPGYLEASSAVHPIDVPRGRVDRSHGDIHPLGNPHYWLDPDNAKRVAHAIAARLSALDSANAADYAANEAALVRSIDQGIERWTRQMAPFRGARIASYHATFNYFLRRFGLTSVGYVEDRPGVPPSPAHLVDLIRGMRAAHVPVLLHESYYDRASSDTVARRAEASVLVLPTSIGGAPRATSYEALMDHLVTSFVAAMQGARP